MAYTFLIPQNIILAIEEKSVPWKTVTIDSKGIEKGKVFTAYIDHTAAKRSSDIVSYVISPASEKIETETYFNKCGHVVKDAKSNTCWAYFFAPGEMDIPGVGKLSSDKKAAVMLKKDTLTASDVQQKNSLINIRLNGSAYKFAFPDGVYAGKSVTLSK